MLKLSSKIFIMTMIVLFWVPSLGQDPLLRSFDWRIGEELIYSVKWTFIKLGELKLQVIREDTLNQRPVYYCRIYLDSSPGLPFITLHDVYESYIDAEELYSHQFRSYEKKDDYLLFTSYRFNYDSHYVAIQIEEIRGSLRKVLVDSMADIPGKVFDSLSMLFYARAMAKSSEDKNLPVFVYSQFKSTNINFTGHQEEIEVKDKEVSGYYLDGKLKFVGVAGVKEDFKGWFSPDPQSIPLKVSMKAFIGSVKIELDQWRNWGGDSILGHTMDKRRNKREVNHVFTTLFYPRE